MHEEQCFIVAENSKPVIMLRAQIKDGVLYVYADRMVDNKVVSPRAYLLGHNVLTLTGIIE